MVGSDLQTYATELLLLQKVVLAPSTVVAGWEMAELNHVCALKSPLSCSLEDPLSSQAIAEEEDENEEDENDL